MNSGPASSKLMFSIFILQSKRNRKRALLKAMLADRVSFVRKLLNGNVKNMMSEFSDDVELSELYYKVRKLLSSNKFVKFTNEAYESLTSEAI